MRNAYFLLFASRSYLNLYLRRGRYFTWPLVKGQVPLPIRYGV